MPVPGELLVRLLHLVFTSDLFSKVAAGLIVLLIGGLFKHVRNRRLRERLEEDCYTPAEIKKRTTGNRPTYVPPDCQDNNPADHGQDVNRRPIFKAIDYLLGPPLLSRFTLILADSGMGKSTFLERYYEYHWRSTGRSRRFKPIIVPLNGLDADELIERIEPQARSETVLFLDALDEDSAAIANFANRFSNLVKLAGRFRAVVVTCRTQFLADVSFVPEEIDLPAPPGPIPLTGGPDRRVRRLYLSPFSNRQVERYLASRFPYWRHPILRVRAGRAAERFKDLVSRPLLLTYIQELATSFEEPRYSFQVYRIIVEGWLGREKKKNKLTIPPENILRFSEDFAVNLFATGRDRAPTAELQSMAERFGVGPVFREVRERSLLHNDVEGNWKFAHSSIMEYFLVTSIVRFFLADAAPKTADRPPWLNLPWTDQMRNFAGEMLKSGECKHLPGADLRGIDLERVDLSCVALSGASLTGANLSNSRLSQTNLSGANLSEARLVNANLDLANVQGAWLDRTILGGSDLGRVRGLNLLQATAAFADQVTTWPVLTLENHGSVGDAAVSGDGQLAISTCGGSLNVWDLRNECVLRTLQGNDKIETLGLSWDGRLAVSAARFESLKVWDVDSGHELRTIALNCRSGLSCGVALSGDGHLAISGSYGEMLRVWEVDRGQELCTLQGSNDQIISVALSWDGRLAVSASLDQTLKVWDVKNGSELRILPGHPAPVTCVAMSGDGRLAISASEDQTVKVWDVESGRELRILRGHSGPVKSIAMSGDGRLAISASDDQTVRAWDVESGRELLTLRGSSGPVFGVSLSADGRVALSASEDDAMQVWFPPYPPDDTLPNDL